MNIFPIFIANPKHCKPKGNLLIPFKMSTPCVFSPVAELVEATEDAPKPALSLRQAQ